ncbi:MAG: kinase-like domain-containing protein, partial [Olpidium bornovanus]
MQQQESPTQQVELQGHPLPQLGPQQIQPRDQQEDAQQQSQGALGPQPRQVAPPAQPSALLESSGRQQPSSSVSPSPASPPLAPAPRDPWRPLVQRPHMGRSLTMTAEMASTAALRRTSSIPAPSAQYKIRRGRGLPEELFSLNPEDYDLKNIIGFGGSAVVHIAAYRPLSKNVAVKVIDLDRFERNQIDELRVRSCCQFRQLTAAVRFQRETQVMSLCRHPHVLRVYGSFVTGSKLYIITPFLSAGLLPSLLRVVVANPGRLLIGQVAIRFLFGYPEARAPRRLPAQKWPYTPVRVDFAKLDVRGGFVDMHLTLLPYRDVKAGNLLMDENGHVLLGDFGVSSSLHDHSDMRGRRKTFVGTPCWMAPEVMEQLGYDYKADM